MRMGSDSPEQLHNSLVLHYYLIIASLLLHYYCISTALLLHYYSITTDFYYINSALLPLCIWKSITTNYFQLLRIITVLTVLITFKNSIKHRKTIELLLPIISSLLPHYYHYYTHYYTNTVLELILLLITTVIDPNVTSYYYHYYHYARFITSITTHISGNNGTITSLLPLHYVLLISLLPIITGIMKPLLPINQVYNRK